MKNLCLVLAFLASTPAFATAYNIRLNASQPEIDHTSHVGVGLALTNGAGLQVIFTEDDIKQNVKTVELASLDVIKTCRFNWVYKKFQTDIFPVENPVGTQEEVACTIDQVKQEIVLAPSIRVKNVTVKILPEAYTQRNANVLLYRLRVQEQLTPVWTYRELLGIAKISPDVQVITHSVFYKANFFSYLTPKFMGAGGTQTGTQIGAVNDEITVQ